MQISKVCVSLTIPKQTKDMKITVNHYPTYSEAVLTNVPENFTSIQQEHLINELNVDILVF